MARDVVTSGLKTGLVVDSGAAATHIVPVSDGHSDPHQIKRLCVAGDHVTQRLSELLLAHGYCITAGHSAAIRELKERCCYVAASYGQELDVCILPCPPLSCSQQPTMSPVLHIDLVQ